MFSALSWLSYSWYLEDQRGAGGGGGGGRVLKSFEGTIFYWRGIDLSRYDVLKKRSRLT